MPKANEVATELRKLADALDKSPEAEIAQLFATFYCYSKEQFLNTASVFPRPFDKPKDEYDFILQNPNGTSPNSPIWLRATVDRSRVCELIEPAKPAVYRCDPILSEAEESMLEVS